MSVSIPKKGAEILRWAQEITRAHNRAVPIAGSGLRQRQTDSGTTLYIGQDFMHVTVDLAGVIHGPFTGAGQFVTVDLSAGTCTQQAVGAVRPSVPPQNEVWIDLSQTVGRVYIPRIG
jgi:hypothetical protein